MGKETDKFAREIKAFCRRHKMSLSGFGRLSSNNSALYYRLTDEKSTGPSIETVARLRFWMENYDERAKNGD